MKLYNCNLLMSNGIFSVILMTDEVADRSYNPCVNDVFKNSQQK